MLNFQCSTSAVTVDPYQNRENSSQNHVRNVLVFQNLTGKELQDPSIPMHPLKFCQNFVGVAH